jgi:hypothetical protein
MVAMKTISRILTAALAVTALGACGESNGDGDGDRTSSTPRDRAFEGALKFARCMRGEGLDLPDPRKDANGLVKIGGPGARLDPADPKVRAAEEKCDKHLRGGGEAPDPAQRARFQDAFVKYARCMRREGVDMPDPKPGQGGLILRFGDPDAPNPESPRFKAADRTCHPLLAELDKAARRERSQ